MSREKFYLRRAARADADLLFEWANDPIVRQNSFHSEPIPYEVHQKWFARMMEDENTVQYILMADGGPVGQIRLIIDGNEAEIGYSISSRHRRKGYGRMILRLAAKEVKRTFPNIKKLVAKVRPENIASRKLFESEGYDMKYSSYALDIKRTVG